MPVQNVFKDIPEKMREEVFELLLQTPHLKLERIISKGHVTPPGRWYDQEMNEWVLLLKGSASLLFEGQSELQHLQPGDSVFIPKHRRHRVEWTDPLEETVWLALHYD